MPRDVIDHFYDSGPPREGRYGGKAAEFYGLALRIGEIGGWIFTAIGVIWGFLQGRLDIRKRFKKQRSIKI